MNTSSNVIDLGCYRLAKQRARDGLTAMAGLPSDKRRGAMRLLIAETTALLYGGVL